MTLGAELAKKVVATRFEDLTPGALTGARMTTTNPGWRVVNASISGDTTAGGAAAWCLGMWVR